MGWASLGVVEDRNVPVLVVVHLGGGAEGGASQAGDEEDGGGGTHLDGRNT